MEKVENASKKKATKRVLCYIALVFLVILLFTPMVFKIVFKDEKKQETKKDVITSLKCEKDIESISSSFKNDIPQNASYRIKGSIETTNENGEKQENEILQVDRPVLRKFQSISSVEYDELENITSININVGSIRGSVDYELIFANISLQEEYFRTQGFTCTKETI